jgi:5,6-dimethylbenzimidazole synthase
MAEFSDAFRGDFARLVKWRRDVRRFRPDPVDPTLLDELLDLAGHAPSVGLSEPWRFVAVTGTAARSRVVASFEACNGDALSDYHGEARHLYARLKLEGLREAPVHLAVFADEATDKGRGLGRRTMPEMLRYSVVTAVHTFWLAARAAGLGVGWVSIIDPDEVRAAACVPGHWSLVAYLCVGWPQEISDTPELERAGWECRERRRDPDGA